MKNKDILAGIDIIREYMPDENDWNFFGYHDVITFGGMDWIPEDSKDHQALIDLGWFVDEEAWCCFT